MKMVHVGILFNLCWLQLAGVFSELLSVMVGDSVTLNSDLTEMMDDDVIQWTFLNKTTLAEINVQDGSVTVYDDVLDGRFRHRLKVDLQTGSLTITNTTTEHTGDYQLKVMRIRNKNITLIVYAPLPVPVISRNSSSSSSLQNCSVLCSVVNVSHVTLSWLKGHSLLSSISVSDLSISLSLPLEVEDQDTNNYSCVLNNSITHRTTHLDTSAVCQPCEEVYCCGSAEAVIRLVLSAVVGIAAVTVLVYDIRG